MIRYADTDQMREVSSELRSLSDDLNYEINTLFSRLSDVPKGTKEWVGFRADYYFGYICKDKWQYKELARSLRLISNEVLREAQELEKNINKYKRK